MIHILIADDDPLIREGLEIVLSKDEELDLEFTAENGDQAVNICRKNHIDIALIDVRMPVKNGVEAVQEIVSTTDTKCIILTTFEEDDLVRQAVSAGAKGYLLKGISPGEIKAAVRLVYSGSTVFNDSVFHKTQVTKKHKMDLSSFSEKEAAIIRLIAKGLSNKEIAEKVFLSEGTVKNYISNILSRLGLKHRTQIAVAFLAGT